MTLSASNVVTFWNLSNIPRHLVPMSPGTDAISSRLFRTASYCETTDDTDDTLHSHLVRQSGFKVFNNASCDIDVCIVAYICLNLPERLTRLLSSCIKLIASLTKLLQLAVCSAIKFAQWAKQWKNNANGWSQLIWAWQPLYWPLMLAALSYVWPQRCALGSESLSKTSLTTDARVLPVVSGGLYNLTNTSQASRVLST